MGRGHKAGGRPYRKKRFAKYRVSGSRGVGRGPSPAVFPQRMFKVLTYCSENFKLSQTTTDVPALRRFRGNSLYDPDFTSTGGQARWTDTLLGVSGGTAPYNRYCVLASKVTVTIWQDPTLTGTNGSTAGIVSLIPTVGTGNLYPSSIAEIQERAFCKWINVGNANSSKPLVLKHFCKTSGVWQGVKPLVDQDFSAGPSADPNKEWLWNLQVVNVINAAGANLFSCYMTFRIKYYVMFSLLNDVADS